MTCHGCGQSHWQWCSECGDRRCLRRRCADCGREQWMLLEELAARNRDGDLAGARLASRHALEPGGAAGIAHD
jgi:hypothetical protein